MGILDQRSIKLQSTSDASPAPELIKDTREKLGWVTQNVADRTLQAITQLSKNFLCLLLQRHFKLREPILNCNCLAEEYCTDTFFSEMKSIEGKMAAQIFVGHSQGLRLLPLSFFPQDSSCKVSGLTLACSNETER